MIVFLNSWLPIPHKAVCDCLMYQEKLMAVYQEALTDQLLCPQEFERILAIEIDELRQDLRSVLN